MNKFNFNDLHFKERTWGLPELACALSGLNTGTEYAELNYENGYSLCVIKGSYLCGKNTYEVGILYKNILCDVDNREKLHNNLLRLGLKHDGSRTLVYGHVTKKQVEKVAVVLEGI